jgi:two-component system, sensor histidine kinase PdtaS
VSKANLQHMSDTELEYRLEQQSILGEFGSFALQSRDLGAVLQRATELCALGLRTPYAKILEYQPEQNRLLMVAGVGWREGLVGEASLGADMASPAGFAYHTGKAVLSNHLENEERFRTPELLAQHGIRRAINVLIEQGNGPTAFGVLEVDSPDDGKFDRSDAAFLAGFGGLIGIAIERQQTDQRLAEAMEHQAMLTREMSHRVKNSLGVVSGLLRIQARGTSSEAVRLALDDAGLRVATVAKVHDHLWRSATIGTVDFGDFLGELCRNLETSGPGHTVRCSVSSGLSIPADKAIPLGLFVNELVTNAFKYAYPPDTHGPVEVTAAIDDGKLQVSVADKGRGLPEDLDLAGSGTHLGLKIITSLAMQLNSALDVTRDMAPGARFAVAVPLDAAS